MIDYATIERIQSAAQITDVVSDFMTLRKRGINYVGLCPFHEDKTPSFYVSPAKNICKCFACGEGGTPLHFIMKHEQLSYVDALKYLAKKYGIEVKETELTDEQKQAQGDRESMFILNTYAQKSFTANLFENLEGKTVGLSYFRERGFRDDIIKKFQLGYSLENRDAFTRQALKAGYKKTYLEKTGLTITGENDYMADRFRGRVMFPVHTLSGKVVSFGGRILKKEKDAKLAKYINSPESEIYHKSNELYGIFFARQAIAKQDRCFLVEGYTDVISMHQAGIENVVASSGTALTHEQIRLIHRLTNNITVIYDGDSAGIKAAIRGINLLLEAGLNIKIVLLPDGEDPDSFARKQNAASFNEFIKENETDFVRFKAGLLMKEAGNDPIKKSQMITEIVDTIAIISEEIIRSLYVKECSRITDVDEGTLIRAIAKKRQELQLQKKKTLYPEVENQDGSKTPVEDQIHPQDSPQNYSGFNFGKTSSLDKYEQTILRYVIRYGEIDMANQKEDEDGLGAPKKKEDLKKEEPVFVIEYIKEELDADQLKFKNPVYQQIIEEAYAKYKEPEFKAEPYFKNHADPVISKIAVDLSTDQYIISKIHSKYKKVPKEVQNLFDTVPYVVTNYKNTLLQNKIDEINVSIKEAEKNNDSEQVILLMKELTSCMQKKKTFATHLRERIITKK
jgi:DNA primase